MVHAMLEKLVPVVQLIVVRVQFHQFAVMITVQVRKTVVPVQEIVVLVQLPPLHQEEAQEEAVRVVSGNGAAVNGVIVMFPYSNLGNVLIWKDVI
jgi:hypothetical protein